MRQFLLRIELDSNSKLYLFSAPTTSAGETLERYRSFQQQYQTSIIVEEDVRGLHFTREISPENLEGMSTGTHTLTWPEARDALYESMLVDALRQHAGSLRRACRQIKTAYNTVALFLEKHYGGSLEAFYDKHNIQPFKTVSRERLSRKRGKYPGA